MIEVCSVTYIAVVRGTSWEVMDHNAYKQIAWGVLLLLLVFLMSAARRYGRSFFDLTEQLTKFSADEAKCFCCCNKHQNPINGGTLSCDRSLVYESIAHWHGGGSRKV